MPPTRGRAYYCPGLCVVGHKKVNDIIKELVQESGRSREPLVRELDENKYKVIAGGRPPQSGQAELERTRASLTIRSTDSRKALLLLREICVPYWGRDANIAKFYESRTKLGFLICT